MNGRNRARLAAVVAGSMTLLACSHESPVGAAAPATAAGTRASGGGGGGGSYVLSFVDSRRQPVTTLTVGSQELILKAHVDDGAGHPATKGSASFQYCSYKGLPPGDITRADEAPSSACASGAASWRLLGTLNVEASGDAYLNFGIVQIPRTVGFRFKYSSQGSNVPSGTSPPQDFTWVAASTI